jgi:hypothetical protein
MAATRATLAGFNTIGYSRCCAIGSSPRETVRYFPCLTFGVHYTVLPLFFAVLFSENSEVENPALPLQTRPASLDVPHGRSNIIKISLCQFNNIPPRTLEDWQTGQGTNPAINGVAFVRRQFSLLPVAITCSRRWNR